MSQKKPSSPRIHLVCGVIFGLLICWVLMRGSRPVRVNGYNLSAFGRMPVQSVGRVKPLSSEAINTMRLLSGKSAIRVEGENGRQVKMPAIQWYVMTLFQPNSTTGMRVFRIDNPEIKDDLSLKADEKLYTYDELLPNRQRIAERAQAADQKQPTEQDRFERNILSLSHKLVTYEMLASSCSFQNDITFGSLARSYNDMMPKVFAMGMDPAAWSEEDKKTMNLFGSMSQVYRALAQDVMLQIVPPDDSDKDAVWHNPYEALILAINSHEPAAPVYATALGQMQDAWLNRDETSHERFNMAVDDYMAAYDASAAGKLNATKTHTETFYNQLQPFYKCIMIYVLTFLVTCIGWLKWGAVLNRYAYALMSIGFVLHTMGIAMQMMITGRPPVTNLYNSALFVGWVAVLLGLVIERIFRHGFATTSAVVIGALSLMKGFQIALEGGDTMGVLVAVLDSNFWLATHVICIVIGYGTCFFAALVGHIYIAQGIFTKSLTKDMARALELAAYGLICFGLIFSVVGTILGGIWADQSWGRFWGWDPKENGALLICLWLIVILHARLGGYLSQRGTMVAAAFASPITAISWFGVNLLGAGLHSYGFTERGLWSFLLFIGIECLICVVGGLLPVSLWRSGDDLAPPQPKTPTPVEPGQAATS